MSTIGEQLRLAREARKLTIKQVAQATHLRAHYLQAMEADEFSSMPSTVQARGFLRLYAEYLSLDANSIIDRFRVENNLEFPLPKPALETTPTKPVPKPEPPPPAPIPKPEEPRAIEVQGPPAPSQQIFNEIGLTLRSRRELISLNLEEIERHTHIRKHNLELIEAGDFDALPSPVQLRGTLSAYASFLDLNADALLLRYAEAIQSRRIERQSPEQQQSVSKKTRSGPPGWLRRFVSPDLIFGGSMILLLLALSIWGAERILSEDTEAQSTPTQGISISDVLLASPIASPTIPEINPTSVGEDGTAFPTLDAAEIEPSSTAFPTVISRVQITVVVTERTFLRVIVDGIIKQDGRAQPGTAITFDGSSRIEVLTGSGAAVEIIFNQNNLGIMGNFGEVVNRIYTIDGMETPTPTATYTPSITPKPSITPIPSATLRPSSTPRPTITPLPSATRTP